MPNLTLSIDDDTLRRARIRALEQGATVNALVRRWLEHYADVDRSRDRAIARLLDLAEAAASGRGNATWTRDSLHER